MKSLLTGSGCLDFLSGIYAFDSAGSGGGGARAATLAAPAAASLDQKRFLVTGGAGYVGSHLVAALIARGDEVAVIDNLRQGHRAAVPDSATLHQVDLAYKYADRLVGIRDGVMAFDLPRAELSRETVRQLYLSEAA